MKKLIFLFFTLIPTLSFGQNGIISGWNWQTSIVFNNINISGAGTDSSNWIYLGNYHFFNLFTELTTDSVAFTKAVGGSLGFDVEYELFHGRSKPSTSSQGFRPKSTLLYKELMSFTISDTTWSYLYQSLHDGTADLSPAVWIRFFLIKDVIHIKTNKGIKFKAILFKQT